MWEDLESDIAALFNDVEYRTLVAFERWSSYLIARDRERHRVLRPPRVCVDARTAKRERMRIKRRDPLVRQRESEYARQRRQRPSVRAKENARKRKRSPEYLERRRIKDRERKRARRELEKANR